VVTDAQKGIVIHYVPAMPRKVLRVEFRIDNNTAQFRSKTDELVTYLIGNRSPGTLSDWLQKQGLVEGIRADSDPVVNGNSGVLAISATLTDKGQANRDEVVAAIFSYLSYCVRKASISAILMNSRTCWISISATRPSPATWITWSGWRIP
jgi:protease-3